IARVVARDHVHHQRDVAYGTRERTDMRDELVAPGRRKHRHAPERRLEPDEPAEAGRDANGARAVGAQRQRRQPGRDRRRAAGARPGAPRGGGGGSRGWRYSRKGGRAAAPPPATPAGLARPTKTAPAVRNAATLGVSSGATNSASRREPDVVRSPAVQRLS